MAFRDKSGAQPVSNVLSIDHAAFAPASRPTEEQLDREAEIVDAIGKDMGFRGEQQTIRPKLRRRLIDEPQDPITLAVRRSVLEKFDLWCAEHGYSKKDGFAEMVRRVTRRTSDPSR